MSEGEVDDSISDRLAGHDPTDGFDASIRTIDLRAAIAIHYRFADAFARQVRRSQSNSLAAIYIRRKYLDEIASDLGIDDYSELNKPALRNAIREACGREPRPQEGFDWLELRAIIREADIKVDPSGYDVEDLGESDTDGVTDNSGVTESPAPGWTDWKGGDRYV